MNVIYYSVGSASGSPQAATWTEPRHNLAQAVTDKAPAVVLVQASDLPKLQELQDLVVDRGKKHPARGLADILLGKPKPTLLRGNYKCTGQMKRSFTTLLDHANKREERNLYIISIDDDLFEECWAAAQRTRQSAPAATAVPSPATRQPAQGANKPRTTRRTAGTTVQRVEPFHPLVYLPLLYEAGTEDRIDLVRMLPDEPVPRGLELMFRGVSEPYQLVRRLLLRVAGQPVTVVILGETGTGKDVVARAIHRFGSRKNKPFIPLDCSAIPAALFESILFGHVKGAFTGADKDKRGLWEAAGGGIIFLDEIGELSLYQQAKLLRALESGRIRRVGEVKERPVRAQVIAATNRDLAAEVAAGRFNESLFFRLFQYVIDTPPLRGNPDDIRELAQAFMQEIKGDPGYTLSEEVIRELQGYRWPGNARELKNVLTMTHTLFPNEELEVRHIRRGMIPIRRMKAPLSNAQKPGQVIAQHRLHCLWHLQRTDQAVRACKVSARDVVYRGMDDAESVEALQASFSRYRDELEGLCLNPLLFHSNATFKVVHRLKALVGDFLMFLSSHLSHALFFWWRKLRQQFKQTQEALFTEVALLEAMYT